MHALPRSLHSSRPTTTTTPYFFFQGYQLTYFAVFTEPSYRTIDFVAKDANTAISFMSWGKCEMCHHELWTRSTLLRLDETTRAESNAHLASDSFLPHTHTPHAHRVLVQ